MAPKAKADSTKSSTKSAATSMNSLKAAATSTLKTLKRKAVKAINIVSPKKRRKKPDTIPDGGQEPSDDDISDKGSLRRQSWKASVIDINDDDDQDSEVPDVVVDPRKGTEAELGEHGYLHTRINRLTVTSVYDAELDISHLRLL